MVDTASAKKEHRCGKEDRPANHARRRRGEGDEHDAPSQCEGSHASMQPTPQPRLDCAKHLGQRVLGVALNRWTGMACLPQGELRAGHLPSDAEARTSSRKLPVGRFRVGDPSDEDQGWAESRTRRISTFPICATRRILDRCGIRCQLWHVLIGCANSWIVYTRQGCCMPPTSIG